MATNSLSFFFFFFFNVLIFLSFLKDIYTGYGFWLIHTFLSTLDKKVLLSSGLWEFWWEICCYSDHFYLMAKVQFPFLLSWFCSFSLISEVILWHIMVQNFGMFFLFKLSPCILKLWFKSLAKALPFSYHFLRNSLQSHPLPPLLLGLCPKATDVQSWLAPHIPEVRFSWAVTAFSHSSWDFLCSWYDE